MRPFILDAVSGVVAHLVEHLVRNQKVVGSSPIYSTRPSRTAFFFIFMSDFGKKGGIILLDGRQNKIY